MNKKIFAGVLASALAVTCAANVSAVELKNAIDFDLEVTDFFGAKTDAVELKDGATLTFEFHNKSNGTEWYHNYVMAITGEVGDAYTGAAEEVLIIRADNWGWGGGLSDFEDANGGNNPLRFETDLNFEDWFAKTQEGVDVKITVSKNGNTINYEAKYAGYTDKLTATSGVDLPDTLYVFFTGDHCTLSNIVKQNNPPADPEPGAGPTEGPGSDPEKDKEPVDSGIEGVAIVAGLAIIAAGAVVVAKKRK